MAKKLIVHGAKVSAKNKMQETPLGLLIDKKQPYFLSSEEKKQLLAVMLSIKDFNLPDSFKADFSRDIMKRRDAILKINVLFLRGAPSIVNRAVIPHRVRHKVNVKAHKKSFREMYKSPYLKPLLNIAAFAVEGLHHLSSRSNERDKKLKIVLGPYEDNEQTTTKATLGTNRNAYGVYYHDNAIYLGGKRDKDDAKSRKLVLGTLVHEITHFVAHEVFDNLAIPYAKGDKEAQEKFSSICNRIQKLSLDTPNCVPEIIRRVFPRQSASYSKDSWHIELIVRVPQLIAMGELEKVREFCPDLLEYYESYFLKACQEHLLKLHYLNDVLLPSANAEKINTGKLRARISHIHFDEAGTLESEDEFGSASESEPEETDRNIANDDDSQCETVKVRVTRDYIAKKEGDLTIHQGDIINLVAEGDEWCRCEIDGKKGRVPAQYLALEFSVTDLNVKSGQSSNSESIYGFWQRNRQSILLGISAAAVGFVALAQVYQGHQEEDDLKSIGRMGPGSLG